MILPDKEWATYGYKLKRSSTFLETIAAFEEHAESNAASPSSKPGMEEAAQAVASVSKRLGRRRDGQGNVKSTDAFHNRHIYTLMLAMFQEAEGSAGSSTPSCFWSASVSW